MSDSFKIQLGLPQFPADDIPPDLYDNFFELHSQSRIYYEVSPSTVGLMHQAVIRGQPLGIVRHCLKAI